MLHLLQHQHLLLQRDSMDEIPTPSQSRWVGYLSIQLQFLRQGLLFYAHSYSDRDFVLSEVSM